MFFLSIFPFFGSDVEIFGLRGFEKTSLHNRMTSFNSKFSKTNIYQIILCIEEVKQQARQNLYMPLILLNMLLDIQKFVNE